jgi:hypothetical protein
MGDALMAPDPSERRMLDGSMAPKCMVRFRCTKCRQEAVLDAYEGVARHDHDGVKFIMEPLTVVRVSDHPFANMPGQRR